LVSLIGPVQNRVFGSFWRVRRQVGDKLDVTHRYETDRNALDNKTLSPTASFIDFASIDPEPSRPILEPYGERISDRAGQMWVVVLLVVGITFCAEIVIGVALHVRSGRKAKKMSIAEYLDQRRIGATTREEKPEADRPSPVPGPTAWKQ